MDFNTPLFLLLFLPCSILFYTLAQGRNKLISGILISLAFYAWGNLVHIPLLMGLILINYFLGTWIDRRREQKYGHALLWCGILVNIGTMLFFKLVDGQMPPLGLSYVAFQLVAYLLETYKRSENRADDLLQFSFYILLFPKIIVGPIVRFSALKEQLRELSVTPSEMASGARRFIIGLAKKALIADTLARLVNPIFALNSPAIPPHWAWLILIAYALQLYFDFSGYTDMALGIGKMMGLKFVENFNFPYISKNIGDFWRRWHISLSSWFRDFVFYPLERRRLKFIGQQLNILIVFVLTGFWHGLAVNFVIWAVIHGVALVFESTWLGRKLRQAWSPIQHGYALFVILLGWVFFRSPTPQFAVAYLYRLAGWAGNINQIPFSQTSPYPFLEPTIIAVIVAGIFFCIPIVPWIEKKFEPFRSKSFVLFVFTQTVYDLVLIFLMALSVASTVSGNFMPNIYGAF